jgi:diguanylate cyclase (GGDEF)-like protein
VRAVHSGTADAHADGSNNISGPIATIVLIAVVANLVIMAVLVGSVIRRRRADERLKNRSAAATTSVGVPPADGQRVDTANHIAATIGASATTVGPVLVLDPTGPDEDEAVTGEHSSAHNTIPETGPGQTGATAPAAIGGEGPSGTDGTDMDEGKHDYRADAIDDGGLVRPHRFTLPPADEPGGAFAAYIANGGHSDHPDSAMGDDDRHESNGMLTDEATGMDNTRAWARSLTEEAARSARYGRPVTVVIAEIDGLDRLSERFGPDASDRLIPPVADALRRNARAADHVARLSGPRFGVLLTETDEVRAINYVERVRAACDRWLEAGAVAVRLSIGWASPPAGGDLASAVHEAEERMYREQRRTAPWRQEPSVHPPAASET